MKVPDWAVKVWRWIFPKVAPGVLIVSEDFGFSAEVRDTLKSQGCYVDDVFAPVAAAFSPFLAYERDRLSLVLVVAESEAYLAFIDHLRQNEKVTCPILGFSSMAAMRREMIEAGANSATEPQLWRGVVLSLLS